MCTFDEVPNGTVDEEQNDTVGGEQIGISDLVHFDIAVLELGGLLENTFAWGRYCKIALVLFDTFVLEQYGRIAVAPANTFAELFALYFVHQNMTFASYYVH